MTEYKHTLNLPHTDFAMKANLAEREPLRLKTWQEANLYQQIRELLAEAESFILHDGPPYANGHLHCGHALNKILKDMIVKSKSLSGFNAPFVPGWDCHGLPIELNVEKKVGKAGVKLDNKAFRTHCRAYANSQITIQRAEFERLGVCADWQHPYTTMQPGYEATIVRALAEIIANGHLHRGFKPVHWCVDCGSALAEAEVDYGTKHRIQLMSLLKPLMPVNF
jgi:isoleucyl-tRNA synthetase